jgi:hypothetical protein
LISWPPPNSRRPKCDEKQLPYLEPIIVLWHVNLIVNWRSQLSDCKLIHIIALKENCCVNCTYSFACRRTKLFARSPGPWDLCTQFLREWNFGEWLRDHPQVKWAKKPARLDASHRPNSSLLGLEAALEHCTVPRLQIRNNFLRVPYYYYYYYYYY